MDWEFKVGDLVVHDPPAYIPGVMFAQRSGVGLVYATGLCGDLNDADHRDSALVRVYWSSGYRTEIHPRQLKPYTAKNDKSIK